MLLLLTANVVGGVVGVGGGNGLFCGVSIVLLETDVVGVDLTGDEPEVLPRPIVLSLSMILIGVMYCKEVILRIERLSISSESPGQLASNLQ